MESIERLQGDKARLEVSISSNRRSAVNYMMSLLIKFIKMFLVFFDRLKRRLWRGKQKSAECEQKSGTSSFIFTV